MPGYDHTLSLRAAPHTMRELLSHRSWPFHATKVRHVQHADLLSGLHKHGVGPAPAASSQPYPRHDPYPYLAASRAARNTHRCRTETSTEGTAGQGFKGRGDQAPTGWMNHRAQEGHRQTVQQNGVTLHAPCFLISWCSCHGWPPADE